MRDADGHIGGRYRLDTRLGSGGMGTVWRGWDERLQRPVAVKKLHMQPWLSTAERDLGIQRAMREARLTARLHHPNSVQVYDVVDEGESPCLIMEYVPARSLQEIVDANGPLSPAEAARIGTQVAAALAAAHRAGIVHRDVKPGNVLIAEDGSAKITDFGISHAFDDVTVTSTGMVTGTPSYLAPEVARGAGSDFASDVYSLGATLYMAVEGRPPFGTDQNPMAILHRVASGSWDPPVRSGPLAPMLARMMAPQAAARPSMVEVANSLPALHPIRPEPSSHTPTHVMPRPGPAAPAMPLAAGGTRVFAPPRTPPPTRPPTPPSTPSAPAKAARQHSRWSMVAAALVVALGSVVAFVLSGMGGDNRDDPTTTSRVPSQAKQAGTPSAARPNSAPTSQELADAVTKYFHVVPRDLDAGWTLLTPQFQRTRAQDRQTYDDYWNTVARVDVSNAYGQPPDGASATLTYHYKNGQVVTQQTQFRFVRHGGVLKIDGEY